MSVQPPSVAPPSDSLPLRLSDLLDPDRDIDWSSLPMGDQEPTHRLVPPAQFTHGYDAIEFAHDVAGYSLDEFQQQALVDFLGFNMVRDSSGEWVEKWAAKETADIESRRNGKSAVIEVLILFGLFILRERKILYTAHLDDTAEEIFDRVVDALKRSPALWAEVVPSGPRRTNGQRAIRLRTGQVALFRTRTVNTARGKGFQRLILDESQELTDSHMPAIMPVITGEPNAQINYAGSAGHLKSEAMAKVWRSFKARERSLAYRGWHAPDEADYEDLRVIARTNPAAGRRLSWEAIAKEAKRMTIVQLGRERCGVSTYPRASGEAWVIPEEDWLRALDESSTPTGPLQLVAESDPELTESTIAVAGRRPDGAMHIEVIAHEPGSLWVRAELVRLAAQHSAGVAIDPKGPLGWLIKALREEDGLDIYEFTVEDVKDAATWIYTQAVPRPDPADPEAGRPAPGVYHRGGKRLTTSLAGATTRKLLDRWAWSRHSLVHAGPIMGVTLAGYRVVLTESTRPTPPPPSPQAARPAQATRPNPRRAHRGVADMGF